MLRFYQVQISCVKGLAPLDRLKTHNAVILQDSRRMNSSESHEDFFFRFFFR